ncbi:MAG TPA: glycosyltransferase [Anaerohalosphaeraceae bacterium]|jgi:1,2-diacylglycerol 3-alpha-glucosyltransferase|nr:glycosyltransferase [Anaerohalosphaeraceae bacterium]HRT51050.1 glycosyltransferase [Anaerohalosphaeraceae bacterium]HRT87036.1 glycosyltransferase [Anaerohalosphaeraceae bacterium]
MNILMMTNTYRPYVGGVARSVEAFTEEFRRRGHRVLVVAPRYENARDDEPGLIRVPAIQNFNGSDMSVRVAIPGLLAAKLANFAPDVVHAHQPFLMGDAALRVAVGRNLPLVFTYHTMWESYGHYVPGDSPVMRRFIVALATGYANLCDTVIAPSRSIRNLLMSRGVQSPVAIIPTGIEVDRFAEGDGNAFRRRTGIPAGAYVVGHVGRLAREKNHSFLARAVARFIGDADNRYFVVVGDGPMREHIETIFADCGLTDRLFAVGRLEGKHLIDAYAAFDVFAFASKTETQGLVLIEAMAAGVPAVALDARGVREVVRDRHNGAILNDQDVDAFADALEWIASRFPDERRQLAENAVQTARRYQLDRCAARTLQLYQNVIHIKKEKPAADTLWESAMRKLNAEWKVWSARAKAGAEALSATAHHS